MCSIRSSHLTVAVTISAVWLNVPSGPATMSDDLSYVLVTRGSVPVVMRRIGWMLSETIPSTSTVNLLDYNDPNGYRFRTAGSGIPDPIDNSISSRLYVANRDARASGMFSKKLKKKVLSSQVIGISVSPSTGFRHVITDTGLAELSTSHFQQTGHIPFSSRAAAAMLVCQTSPQAQRLPTQSLGILQARSGEQPIPMRIPMRT